MKGYIILKKKNRYLNLITLLLFLSGCSINQNVESTSEESTIQETDIVITDNFDTLGETTPAGIDAEPIQEENSEIALEKSKEVVKKKKEEEKRLAEEKRKKEEAERKAKEEQERLAQQKAEEEKQTQQAKAETTNKESSKNQQNNQSSNKTTSQPKEETKQESKPQQTRTDGFNYKGHHYSLANFSGSGAVPQETNNVYQWSNKPSHYLVERISPAGRTIRQVGVGDQVTINGNTYTIKKVQSGIPNDTNAISKIDSVSHSISFQTCDLTQTNGLSDVTIWWAD